MDSDDEYAPSPSPVALPRQPSPVLSPCRPPSPPRAASGEVHAAFGRTPGGPVGTSEALGHEAAADEVEEIPQVIPSLGLQGDTRERLWAAWAESDLESVIDEERESDELDQLFDLCYGVQHLIKVSIVF